MKCLFCNSEFSLNGRTGGQNRQFCYVCMPEGLAQKDRDAIRRKLLYEKASIEKVKQGCSICGYNKCGAALEWHHNDGNEKINNPGTALSWSWKKYIEETEKCILVCANCHREIHLGV